MVSCYRQTVANQTIGIFKDSAKLTVERLFLSPAFLWLIYKDATMAGRQPLLHKCRPIELFYWRTNEDYEYQVNEISITRVQKRAGSIHFRNKINKCQTSQRKETRNLRQSPT